MWRARRGERLRQGSRLLELGLSRDTALRLPVRDRHRALPLPVLVRLGSSAQEADICWCANRASHHQEAINPVHLAHLFHRSRRHVI
jgi:hypothetical protein